MFWVYRSFGTIFQSVSGRLPERKRRKSGRREKYPNNPHICTYCKHSRLLPYYYRPGTGNLPSIIAPPDYHMVGWGEAGAGRHKRERESKNTNKENGRRNKRRRNRFALVRRAISLFLNALFSQRWYLGRVNYEKLCDCAVQLQPLCHACRVRPVCANVHFGYQPRCIFAVCIQDRYKIQDISSLLRIFDPHRSTYSGTECTNKSEQERIPK